MTLETPLIYSPVQVQILAKRAIDVETAMAYGVLGAQTEADLPEECPDYWTVEAGYLPGLVFRWHSPVTGQIQWQLRPDVPVGDAKYVFGKGSMPILNRLWGRTNGPILITEGTCQTIATAAAAPAHVSVYGIAGCQSWTRNGVPIEDLDVVEGRDVLIALDADAASNWSVYDAGVRLRAACLAAGAGTVRFLRVPGGGKSGLDDVLAGQRPQKRTTYLARLIELTLSAPAREKPEAPAAVKPRPRKGDQHGEGEELVWFGEGGLLVEDVALAVLADQPAALTAERTVAIYSGGVYRLDPDALAIVTTAMLRNDWRPGHHGAVEGFVVAELARQGRRVVDRMLAPYLNVANGMVDLRTGMLGGHHPNHGSVFQLPVRFDPAAVCPVYDAWTAAQVGDQLADLEEAVSAMLDPTTTPGKAVFLFGPSRTGKGTFLRLLAAMAGPGNRSAVSLHQLTGDKYMAAPLYGKILNVSGDLSSAHVEDISMFKMMTGEDPIEANRKYGRPFSFTNRALFAFSANTLPSIGEDSAAYSNRIKPFRFGVTYQGQENPETELEMMGELPGILNRWIAAWQRRRDRGRELVTDPGVRRAFEIASDRVQQFIDHCLVIDDASFSTTTELFVAFKQWAESEARAGLGKSRFAERLRNSATGLAEARNSATKARGWNVYIRPRGEWGESSNVDNSPSSDTVDGGKGGRVDPTLSDPGGSNFLQNSKNVAAPPVENNGVNSANSATDNTRQPSTEQGTMTNVDITSGSVTVRPGTLVFDIESADKKLWPPFPGFIRITGVQTGSTIRIIDNPETVVKAFSAATTVTGHNVLGFDLLAFALHHGVDVEALTMADAVHDTMLTEILNNPPVAGTKQGQILKEYSLDALGVRKFGSGKTDDLKALAEEFGGFDLIPPSDPRYRAYCQGDVDVTARLAATQVRTPYVIREHRAAGVAARIRLNGFRVDLDLLAKRVAAGKATRERLRDRLAAEYGLPLVDGKGKPYAAPQASKAGKLAIAAAFFDLGVRLATTPASGVPALGKEALDTVALRHQSDPDVVELVHVVQELNGVRSVYDTVNRCKIGDRVHPNITMYQASGRWSFSEPGLTVMGKRGGRHVEREIFLPEPGEFLITCDMSQIDARMVAVHAQDPAYLELFEPGRDLHAENALRIWGDASRRDEAKVLGHGWNYSMGITKLALTCGSMETATEFDSSMRSLYPGLVAWKETVAAQADAGQILDNGWGRKIRCTPRRGWTQAPALIGQSAAMDALKHGLLRLPLWVRPMLRAVIHDEAIFSVPAAEVATVEELVVEAMSFRVDLGRPLGVQVESGLGKRGLNWGACYEK